MVLVRINPLPNDKVLDWFKLKAFADDNVEFAKVVIFVFDRVENIVGKRENASLKGFLQRVVKSRDYVVKSY